MKIHVIGCATDLSHPNLKLLKEKLDIYILPLVLPFDWEGYSATYSTNEFIKNLPEDDVIVATDVYDVLPLNGCNKQILEQKLLHNLDLNKIIFAAESNCFPDGNLSNLYPKHESKWRFLNGGGYISTVKLLKHLIKQILPSIKGSINQRELTKFLLNNPDLMTLDYTCEVFQTLWNGSVGASMNTNDFIFDINNKSIINKMFNTKPLLFHGNGKTNMSILGQYI
jgi:hypothetical protein